MNKRLHLCVAIGFVLMVFVSACNASSSDVTLPDNVDTLELDYEEMPLGENEVKHISGTSSIESLPVQLEGPGRLSVYWRQDCDKFALSMLNTNQTLAEAPLGSLYFEYAVGASEYVEAAPWAIPFEYIPGEYKIVVLAEGKTCHWEVWATVIYPEGE